MKPAAVPMTVNSNCVVNPSDRDAANGRCRSPSHGRPEQCSNGWLWEADEPVEVTGVDYLAIAASDLERSIDFYRRVFGFWIVEDAREQKHPCVLMHSRGGVHLKIYAHRDAPASAVRPRRRWRFVVGDIDRARKAVWNLGVTPSDGTIEPQSVSGQGELRGFPIRDPNGHEIELVEGRPPRLRACPLMRRSAHSFHRRGTRACPHRSPGASHGKHHR